MPGMVDRITELTIKFKERTLTPAEHAELAEWLALPANQEAFDKRISEQSTLEGLSDLEQADMAKIINRGKIVYPPGTIYEPRFKNNGLWYIRWRAYAGIAAILLCLATGMILYLRQRPEQGTSQAVIGDNRNDVPPGGNKATLRLGNGSVIYLDSAHTGAIAQQGNSNVIKVAGGQLAYRSKGGVSEAVLNTVSTPAGGQYAVILADGTIVRLNAESSITFPSAFQGTNREVKITGEAYFEVAKNPHQPFTVHVNDMSVTVLGTHFNIMAYTDEERVETTLLEGAVKINRGVEEAMLVPGDQARMEKAITVVHNVNTEAVVGWTENMFIFSHADIKTVMRAVARWYQVDVHFEGDVSKQLISAQLGREVYLSHLLKVLEASGYHFRIDNAKSITVIPKEK